MAELSLPRMDFSSLGQLPKLYREGVNRQSLADLGRGLADGTVDYRQAAAQTAGMGDITHTLQFLALAESRKKQEDELKASGQFTEGLKGMYGAQPGPASPMPNPAPIPGSRPMASADPGLPAATPRAAVQPSGKVWGDAEAEAAGIYEPSAKPMTLAALGTPSPLDGAQWPHGPVGAPSQAPVRVAQATPGAPMPANAGLPSGVTPRALQLIEASGNPRLPQAQREIAKTLLAHEMDGAKATNDMKEWAFAKAQDPSTPDYTTWARANKAAGKTEVNIDTKGEGEFEKEFGKGQAKRWNSYIEGGQAAQKKMVDINSMREISTRLGSQGAAANIKEAIGPYAEALGVNIDGLSDVQAYSSIVQRLAPQQRAEGSGSTSDVEFKGFLKSLPTLSQNPAAREATLNTMEALTRDEMARGEIATQLATGEIKRKDAEKALRALPDPMQSFTEWRKANPGVYGQAIKGAQGGATAAPSAPAAKPMKFTPQETDESLSNAKAAIKANPAARDAIIKKVRDSGLSTDGL